MGQVVELLGGLSLPTLHRAWRASDPRPYGLLVAGKDKEQGRRTSWSLPLAHWVEGFLSMSLLFGRVFLRSAGSTKGGGPSLRQEVESQWRWIVPSKRVRPPRPSGICRFGRCNSSWVHASLPCSEVKKKEKPRDWANLLGSSVITRALQPMSVFAHLPTHPPTQEAGWQGMSGMARPTWGGRPD